MRTSRLYHQLHNLLSQPMTWAVSTTLTRTAAGEVFEQLSGARSPLHQTTDKTQNGIWFVQHGTANPILLGYDA